MWQEVETLNGTLFTLLKYLGAVYNTAAWHADSSWAECARTVQMSNAEVTTTLITTAWPCLLPQLHTACTEQQVIL